MTTTTVNADDYATLQDAIDDAAATGYVEVLLSAQTYTISTPLTFPSTGMPVKLRGVPNDYTGSAGSIVQATSSMDYVLGVLGPYNEIDSIKFDANRQATYGLFLQNASLMRCRNVMVTSALVDGVHLDDSGINDTMLWQSCIVEQNGTTHLTSGISGDYSGGGHTHVVTGTASITASSATVTFSGAPALTGLGIRKGDWLRVGGTKATAFYGQIESVTSSTITLQVNSSNLPTTTASGQDYAIGVGDGWHETRHNDNNCNKFDQCLFRLNGGSGLRVDGLFGPTMIGGQSDFNNFGAFSLGPADNVGAVFNLVLANVFTESNTFTFGFGQIFNASIISPTSGGDTIFRVGELTQGTMLRNGLYESIELGAQQNFIVQVRNNAGTLEHRIVADAVQGWASVQAAKITSPSFTYSTTPTISSGTGFTHGVGVVSGSTHILMVDAEGTQNVAISGTAAIEDDSTGATHHISLSTDSRNIGGVTKNRLVLYLRDTAGGFVNWNTTSIASGKSIAIRVQAYIR